MYAARASEELRAGGHKAGHLSVFIRTGGFNTTEPNYSNSAVTRLNPPASDTRTILKHSIRMLDSIWRAGYRFAKAGVILQDFNAEGVK